MSRWTKLLASMRASQANVRFSDLVALVLHIGYTHKRTHGSHHVYSHPDRPVLSIQPINGKAKPYQVRQVIAEIDRYKIEVK